MQVTRFMYYLALYKATFDGFFIYFQLMVVIAIGSNGAIVLPPVAGAEERAAGNVTTLFRSMMERTVLDPYCKQSIAI